MKKLLTLFRNDNSGDTIIEVMISMVILALVLTVADVSVVRSLQRSIDVGYRDQAVGYAQDQIEKIKFATVGITPPVALSTYKANPGQPFCIKNNFQYNGPGICAESLMFAGVPADRKISIVYDNVSLFTVTATWAAATGNNNQVQLYYKIPSPPPPPPLPPPPPPPPPLPKPSISLALGDPTGFKPSSLRLHASVNPNGYVLTSCYFKNGMNTSFQWPNSPTNGADNIEGVTTCCHVTTSAHVAGDCGDTYTCAKGNLWTCFADNNGHEVNISVGTDNGHAPHLANGEKLYFQFCAANAGGESCTPTCWAIVKSDGTGSWGPNTAGCNT